MAVYVDEAVNFWRKTYWCHMFADTASELHLFAERMGLKRDWFQPDIRLPHYDLTKSKREIAVRVGSIEVDRRFVYERIVRNVKTHKLVKDIQRQRRKDA